MSNKTQSSWEFACEWYTVEALQAYLRHSQSDMPTDVHSDEFAEWLTEQRRLAMARGIVIGEQRQKETGELMLAENNEPVEAALERPKLYLWVWTEFSTNPNLPFGLAFAIAGTEEQAKKLVEGQHGCQVDDWGRAKQLEVCNPVAFCISGSE